jgi:hypothetical protein
MRVLPRPVSILKVGVATGAAAVGAAAIGAIAAGAVAVGALAIGKLAIGKLKLKFGRFETLHVGELTVDHLIVKTQTAAGSLPTNR